MPPTQLTPQTEGRQGSPSQNPLPQIALPKGGGAIQGIGEKFSTNSMTGTASLSLPIATSPGRSGFGPSLTLNYDSGSGNGIFGVGWQLSLPSITRKTDKGLPRYRDSEESDVFILSGSEDLVPVLQCRTDGEWERKEVERDGFLVRFYRPRVEGLFARIERWTRTRDGDIHWRSFSKDNVLTVYGDTPNSRICDPAHPHHVFKWLISASYDGRGNAVRYEYAAEDLRNVDPAKPSEHRRAPPCNRYPKRIRYGNRTPLHYGDAGGDRGGGRGSDEDNDADWMFDVVFDFGDEDYRQHHKSGVGDFVEFENDISNGWPVRRDAFSSYRSAFEIRTYRLCRRVLMFHRFPDELGVPRYLVRSTEFAYDEKAIGTFLTAAVQSGCTRQADGTYLRKSLPPLEFGYTQSPLEADDPGPFDLTEAEAANLPEGIAGSDYRWVDLDGEGISGILSEEGAGWYFKHNLGSGRFAATATVAAKPATARLRSPNQQLLDLVGNGNLDLVELAPGRAGSYERVRAADEGAAGIDAGWGRFRPFRDQPVVDWRSSDLRLVDLTGDGIPDILVTEDVAFRWHPSFLAAGFGPAVRIPAPVDEDDGPRIVFADPMQSIYLADMTGDGLTDIVRIRNGEVCYWPNQGYGRFGRKIVMDCSPWFDAPGLFDNRRIRLADTDGSGVADILYLAGTELCVYLNECGNALSERKVLCGLPLPGNDSISVVDFLGRGTACLVWSSPLRSNQLRPLRYVDLMRGVKPHLLNRIVNNLGAETVIDYASSTEFYLADKAAGRPWVTPLPFPVHVVKKVETFDYASRHRFVSTRSYHHGYFDGVEREFRGFGRIDRLDTEDFDDGDAHRRFPDTANEDAAWRVPPVLTKTWYHTGVFLGVDQVSRHLAHEYYREPGDGAQVRLDDTILPHDLAPEEAREACRALTGLLLRQEVYGLDGSEAMPRPYTASESNETLRLLQPRAGNRHCVIFAHARENVAINYERQLVFTPQGPRADPRVSHDLTLKVDKFGNVVETVTIAYGRRFAAPSELLSEGDRAVQAHLLVTTAANAYTNAVDDPAAYRIPARAAARSYELVGTPTPRDDARLLGFEQVQGLVAAAGDGRHDLPFEDMGAAATEAATGLTGSHPCRRLIQETRTLFRADDLSRLLPPGELQALALPGETYSLALTPGLIAQVYGERLSDLGNVLHRDCGYVDIAGDGRWWVPSGRIFYSPEADDDPAAELAHARRHFFLPRRFRDPFGNTASNHYDRHDLASIESRDAVGNVIRARLDYRVLQAIEVTDANGNRSAAAFDALSRVVGTALMGKAGEDVGDSLVGFVADLPEQVILDHIAEPLKDPWAILGNATMRLVYDVFAFDRTRCDARPLPAVTYKLARETHVSDLAPGELTKVQHSFSYSDGFGREVQKKVQAEPRPLGDRGDVRDATPWWIGSGWTIFDNKGNAVRQYEPFFSPTHRFEFAMAVGVSSTLLYDPVGRVVATLRPDHTFDKTVFDPWCQRRWDANDTVLLDPAQDPDVGPLIRRVPFTEYLPTWYQQRAAGELGEAAQRAAHQAGAHADTPAITFTDPLGRSFLLVAHNRVRHGKTVTDEFYKTRLSLDIQGNERSVTDARGRVAASYDYDIRKQRIHEKCADSGQRWSLGDVAGKPILRFDSRHFRLRSEYDALRRPTTLHVAAGAGPARLVERAEYGESQPDAIAHNLRGKLYRQYDEAGIATMPSYDFKGNLLTSRRQMLAAYRDEVDWASVPRLDDETYASETAYDALNRPIALTAPDRSVVRPIYNDTGLIKRLDVSLKGTDGFKPFIRDIGYNAKSQRTLIDYGNGARSTNHYDPLTFRLIRLQTARRSDGTVLQDLHYVYDPVGNITSIGDAAQQTVYFKNQVVTASGQYVYDAIYRLIEATGREHAGASGQSATSFDDAARTRLPLPGDGRAMHNYRERYRYDAVGNIAELMHAAPEHASWRRHYEYGDDATGNRLTGTSIGDLEGRYAYDAAGNMIRMPHLPEMRWDFANRLAATRSQIVPEGDTAGITYYTYDATGQRTRKVTLSTAGRRGTERLYLGGFEVYREYGGDGETITLERTSLHIIDDARRVAIVESRADETTIRYQFPNHLGSAVLELDDRSAILTYEEYYPFGSTSYQAGRSVAETSLKRYRYTGKERDAETGFYYHGARYYAEWLGRWISCDPAGMVDGSNLYAYARNNPIGNADANGMQCDSTNSSCMVDPTAPTPREEALQQSLPEDERYGDPQSLPDPTGLPGVGASITNIGISILPPTIGDAPPGTNFASEAAQGRAAFRAANVMPPGTQAQHWTKELSAAATNMDPDVMNLNMSPLQSRNALPATTLLSDPNGGGTQYLVDGGSTYGNEHKFADRFLIRQIEDQIWAANPNANPREVAVEAGRQARWIMTGEPGPSPIPPPSGLNTALRVGGTALAVGGTVFSGYNFYQDVSQGNWVSAAVDGTGFAGGGLALGGAAAGSSTLVGAGTVIGAPAAVIGAGVAGWKIGQYTNENTPIGDVAAAGGSAVESLTGSTTLGAVGAAGTAILTAPVFVPIAVGKGIGRGAVWLWDKIF